MRSEGRGLALLREGPQLGAERQGVRGAKPGVAAAGADGTFEGYASLFGQSDRGLDVVMAGAFKASLARRGAAGVKMLFQHDPNQPIGRWITLNEDRRGLFVRGQVLDEVDRGREVLALMRAGVLDGLSIGFKAVRTRRDRVKGVRRLDAIDLWEISVVTFPMLEGARVSAVKRGLEGLQRR